MPLYRECTNSELKLCPGDWKYGSFYTTIITECRLYQAWAQRRYNNEIDATKLQKLNKKKISDAGSKLMGER